MKNNVDVRKATLEDIEGILNLQHIYLYTNLSPEDRLKGFVTTPFTSSQVRQVIHDEGLFVASDNGSIIGYVFSGTWAYFSSWPIFPFMLSSISGMTYQNTIINDTNTFQYGPVCIDKAYRGTSLFQELFEEMRIHLAEKFAVGMTFINKINSHSYHAHTRKLGLEVISEFYFNGNTYYALAFDTGRSVL
ncbi:MAG: GNAT family acetyltransferase [Saprospiraceae bacterium]|nr:GNAT family acetyltransferase [Saprospiraceae bacterium]